MNPLPGFNAGIDVHNLAEGTVSVPRRRSMQACDSAQRVFSIPENLSSGADNIYFIDLVLSDAAGRVLSRNFYWVPGTLTTFDWAKTDYTHTPTASHEDLSALTSLLPAKVVAGAEIQKHTARPRAAIASRQPIHGFGLPIARLCSHPVRRPDRAVFCPTRLD